jgi:hypothetical protein
MNYQQYQQYKKRKKTFKQRLISQISYIRTYKIEIPFNEFVAGIKNLYYWIPIVWKDNNNEYAVFEFLKSKLIKQLKSLKRFQNNKEFKFLGFYFFERHLVDNLEDLKYLKIAIDLIDKIYKVFFSSTLQKKILLENQKYLMNNFSDKDFKYKLLSIFK